MLNPYGGSTNTNNGDDDGLIDTTAESYLAWQHLALSSFIDGSFAGSRSDTNVVLEVDIPSGPYTKSGYRIIQENQKISTYVNALTFGKVRTGDNVDAGVLTPRQAHIIDQKIDDVNPSEGRLVTTDGNGVTAGTCIVENAGGDQDDEYDLSVTSKSCVILYYLENI
jgi:hypothetical protein